MIEKGILFSDKIKINDSISVMIPSLKDVYENEQNYYSLVSAVCSTPYDMMVQLDDIGIDFSQINDFELFVLMSGIFKEIDTSLLFGDFSFADFAPATNNQNGELVLVDEKRNIIIDKSIHYEIARALRKINYMEYRPYKPGNTEAKKYMIERARVKQQRAAKKKTPSQLEDLIIAVVNAQEFKYDYTSIMGLTIYQFNASVNQIIHKVEYDGLIYGIYSGNIKIKDIDQSKLNWLQHKKPVI